jgi:hypothetical protein
MDFSEKIKKFKRDNNLNNRQLCKRMHGYSETLFSKQANAKTPSPTLVITMGKYFDIDYNYFLKSDNAQGAEEPAASYGKTNIEIINDIEAKLALLKKQISQ